MSPRQPVDLEGYLGAHFAGWLRTTSDCVQAHMAAGKNVLPLIEDAVAELRKQFGFELELLPVQMKPENQPLPDPAATTPAKPERSDG